MDEQPEFLLCVECETPCYVFEWEGGRLVEAICTACGNDDITLFATAEEYEEQSGA